MKMILTALSEEDADAVLECLDAKEYEMADAEREIKRYADLECFDIVESESEQSIAIIKVKLKRKSGSRTITYRLGKKDQGWVIYN